MQYGIYVVYDSKAEAYNTPVFYQNDQVALRAFKDAANSPESSISRYPEDYTFFLLGQYDDTTAQIDLMGTPKSIARAIELTEANNVQELQRVNEQ